ncbi:hypothetical protein A7C99_4649 [Trichophyton rubrum]|uniref:Rhodopsin family protein n=1 Tax=Trichophyton rubrum TaxID=5551 RepID=A0A178EW27_TRIRU|nr:hypothetical protein A7C99_4649 [Trichophyton rubrum]
MAICITFGTHEFTSQLQGYENVTAQCQNCGNWSGRCITRWPFFTVCFIEVYCHICRFSQDMSMRPDVQSQGPGGHGQGPPPGGPPQQYYGPPPGQQGPYQQYQPPQQPGYK